MEKPSQIKLSVSFIRQGKQIVAYSPALDLSTVGKSEKDAKRRFENAVDIFFEELVETGNLEKVLYGLGWQKKPERQWEPPKVMREQSVGVRIPVAA